MKKILGLLLLVVMLASCGEETLVVRTPQHVYLASGEQLQIEVESSMKVTYSSTNDFHAVVDENGLVTARYVGDVQIRLSTPAVTEFILVSVIPQHTLYVEPYFEIGSTRYAVEKMYGKPYREDENCLVYQTPGVDATEYFYFCFDGSDNLVASVVTIKDGNEEELRKFLAERYVTVNEQEWTYRNTLEVGEETAEIRSFVSEKYGSRVVVYAAYGTDFGSFMKFAEPLKCCRR